jgi:hypothetical protein
MLLAQLYVFVWTSIFQAIISAVMSYAPLVKTAFGLIDINFIILMPCFSTWNKIDICWNCHCSWGTYEHCMGGVTFLETSACSDLWKIHVRMVILLFCFHTALQLHRSRYFGIQSTFLLLRAPRICCKEGGRSCTVSCGLCICYQYRWCISQGTWNHLDKRRRVGICVVSIIR